jgi:hypothetical protein
MFTVAIDNCDRVTCTTDCQIGNGILIYLFFRKHVIHCPLVKTIKTGHVKQHEAGYAGRVKRHLWQNLIAANE